MRSWALRAEPGRRGLWPWVECIVAPLLVAGLAYVIRPQDPFLLDLEFPWLMLVPLLLALRYGALLGLVSLSVLAVVWLVERSAGVFSAEVPGLLATGAVIVTLVCGEFAGLWEARLTRADGALRYMSGKLERLTRQHYLLLRSQRKLEQEHLGRPVTLRSALGRIRTLAGEDAAAGTLPAAPALLGLLGQFCQLEAAGLYDCRAGAPARDPAAAIGGAQPLAGDDPMVRAALEEKALAHLQAPGPRFDHSRYVVVAPAASSDGALVALLAIERLPFLALHEENLSMIAVTLGYYADALSLSRSARVIQHAMPQCPVEFADELTRLQRMRRDYGVASSLALLRFGDHPDTSAFRSFIRQQVRDLDLVWDLHAADDTRPPELLLLLPLAGEAGVEEGFARLERALEARYNVGFDAAGIRPYSVPLGTEDAFVTLKLFLDMHDVRL